MAQQDDSILSLIGSGVWSSALFTTFTLSLTYLESHVLPRLRKHGCQRLTVLSDVAGYRDSLMEQRAKAVGRDYSVVPVYVKSGIFHPKLVHLRAREGDEDLLLVGSGNLTYPGHGGNVEVLEALRPSMHARAFNQASDFFELLVATPGISVADSVAAMDASERLRDVAARGADTEDVQFIHSIERSGSDQLVEAARASDKPWRELLVLSPYHHPAAQPVRRLLEALTIKRLTVGVSGKPREGSAFPFDEAKTFGLSQTKTVAPVTAKGDRRSLHAKWVELRRPGAALVLTGSFNATTESLDTTHNVECGVLRRLVGPLEEPWKEVAEPPYVRGEFPSRDGDQLSCCLFATFDAASVLSGSLLDAKNPAGEWQGRLETAEQILGDDSVVVKEDGAFQWKGGWRVDEVTASTLQLTLTRDGVEARGWVQVSRVLNMRASERSLLQAMAQMNAGTHSSDDMGTVLDYIASHAGSLFEAAPNASATAPAAGTTSGSTSGEARAPVEHTLSPEQFQSLRDSQGIPNRYDSGLMLDAIDRGYHGWDLLRHICAALMPLPRAQGTKKEGDGSWSSFSDGSLSDGQEEEVDTKDLESRQRQLATAYAEFERQLLAATHATSKALTPVQLAAAEIGKSRLLLMWSWVELRFRLIELGQVEATQSFLWKWLRQVCELRLANDLKSHLDHQVCGVAAACALWLGELPKRPGDRANTPEQVHRLLDRYFAGPVPPSARAAAEEWLATEPGQRLTQGRSAAALDALDLLLARPTARQVLKSVMSGESGQPQEAGTRVLGEERTKALFGESNVKALKSLLAAKAEGRIAYGLVNPRTLTSCPSCSHDYRTQRSSLGTTLELNSEISWRLRQQAMVECPYCRKVLLALEP